jgi:hypothetical protein
MLDPARAQPGRRSAILCQSNLMYRIVLALLLAALVAPAGEASARTSALKSRTTEPTARSGTAIHGQVLILCAGQPRPDRPQFRAPSTPSRSRTLAHPPAKTTAACKVYIGLGQQNKERERDAASIWR